MVGEANKSDGSLRLYSKRGNDLSFRFPDLVRAVATMPSVMLDGEIIALDHQSLPNSEALQRAHRDYLHTFWAFSATEALGVPRICRGWMRFEQVRCASGVRILSGASFSLRRAEKCDRGSCFRRADLKTPPGKPVVFG